MPTLDDLITLPKNLALAGDDNFAIADTSSSAGTLMEQVPAALVSKYTHAFLFNFDGATLSHNGRLKHADVLGPFSSADRIVTDATVIITKAFVGLGSSPKVDLGIHDLNTDGDGAPDNIVNNLPLNAVGAAIFNSSSDEAAEGVLIPSDDKIRVSFDATPSSELGDATAGQVVILINIINVNDYIDIIPALD